MKSTLVPFANFVGTATPHLACLPRAAASSGSITHSGSNAAISEVCVTTAAGYNALPLTTAVTDLQVATILERSNDSAGYSITLSSGNWSSGSGPAFKSADSVDILPYTIQYGTKAVSFSNGVATVTNNSSRTSAAGLSNSLTVSFDGTAVFLGAKSSGSTYSDTLTFTIIAK
ncbi:MAG: hypothetical protein WCL50_11060 [Spirochaetota bacterium]